MGISDLEESARRTKDNQRRAELIAQLRDLEDGDEKEENKPTLLEGGGRTIIDKMHNPQNLHDRQIHTNIPKSILTNLMMMDGIEEGLRKLVECDDISVKGNNLTLWRKIDSQQVISSKNRFKYKIMKYSAYKRALFYADAMQGFSGNLLELLMSVDGWRSIQGVEELGSVANTEFQRRTGDNQQNWIQRQISKVLPK